MVQLPWKTIWQFPKWLSTELPYELAILFLDIYPREMKTYSYKNLYAMFASAANILKKIEVIQKVTISPA